MTRKKITTLAYRALRIEGGLIPADELTRLTTLADPGSTEQAEHHYRIPKGLKLRDEIGRDFKIALTLWKDFQVLRMRTDVNAHDVTIREFLLPLMRDVLHFANSGPCAPVESNGRSYAIGHAAEQGIVPLVFAAHDHPLDTPAERYGEAHPDTGKVRRRSPYMLAQEALNATDTSLWAIVTNGLKLRILRDNPSLTRPAYVEIDLEALFTEELLPDFTAFWLLAHGSRFSLPLGESTNCIWERWRETGLAVGETVRTNLRYQVAEALRALGTGFLSHPANGQLRAALQQTDGEGILSHQAFFEELLCLVYRLIFLSTVEDRVDGGKPLIFTPDTTQETQERYLAGYSMTWLRERAVRRSQHDRHSDLWQALTVTFRSLAGGEPQLGLPMLGGLFAADQCEQLDGAHLENRWLLAAVFELGWFRASGNLTRVNYRDMGPEELGSVYESLLELVPNLQMLSQPTAARLAFVGDDDSEGSTKGNTRKLTGSYYTPDSLVQELIKTALEPVIADTVQGNPTRPVEALLELTVCDPACGSGHFLLAAARRLADEVALHRAAAEREGGAPTPTDYRHALRDVVSRCIFGVDKNPMAIQLAKTSLWLEAYTPDRPLSFVDHHLQIGDALLGVLDPQVLEHGIPDAAYTALSGDDKAVAAALRKQNKADLKSWKAIAAGDLFTKAGLATNAVAIETLADETPEDIAAKREAWHEAQEAAHRSPLARLADTYVAAFLAPKLADTVEQIPMSGYLWGVFTGHTLSTDIEEAAEQLCRSHSVFHWWLVFPQVAANGGFSVMLGNPPWERIKLQEEEFFASRSPLVATARNKAERSQRIEWLREGVLLHNLNPDLERAEGLTPPNKAEMSLYSAFIAARRGAEAASLYVHDGRRYPLTGVGDVNTYALFAETFLQAMSPQGRSGFIVPTGIATDDSTKAYFGYVASNGKLATLYDFENSEAVFPAVHRSYKFSLLTLGSVQQAEFVCFATQVSHLNDSRRRFRLAPDEFALINPNTRTCPVFRSERDAELTKKLYRAAPVLIRESQVDSEGNLLGAESNPWGIRFQTMFHMSNDSGLFLEKPGTANCLPLYEAKMIHQFDHRWASYVDAPDKPSGVETADVNVEQKVNPAYTVRPRYWVAEREVLARIACVPARVARAWLILNAATTSSPSEDDTLTELTLGLATWVAGELFIRAAGEPEQLKESGQVGWPQHHTLPHITPTQNQLNIRFGRLSSVLLANGLSTKKALTEFPKWALQNINTRLSDAELEELSQALRGEKVGHLIVVLMDRWMDLRSPNWCVVMRGVARATDERTMICASTSRVGLGNSAPLFEINQDISPPLRACLLASLNSLIVDFAARFKVGGINMNFFLVKQFPVISPEHYKSQDIEFIVPRVLELTYTAEDLNHFCADLAVYDRRPAAERGRPFTWNTERRAQLRAELDAYYAHLFGLTRDELRYVLDPDDVMGPDYPSETFRVLKNNEIREFGEYRTQRLVLEAWDRQGEVLAQDSQLVLPTPVQYSPQGYIRNEEEAKLAGLVIALVERHPNGCSVAELQTLVALSTGAAEYLEPADGQLLKSLTERLGTTTAPLLERVRPIIQRLEAVSALVRESRGVESFYKRGDGALPRDVSLLAEHTDIARLLCEAELRRLAAESAAADSNSVAPSSTGTR